MYIVNTKMFKKWTMSIKYFLQLKILRGHLGDFFCFLELVLELKKIGQVLSLVANVGGSPCQFFVKPVRKYSCENKCFWAFDPRFVSTLTLSFSLLTWKFLILLKRL